MRKPKRKPSSTQRDRAYIEVAKHLKKRGVLSPQTKLHGGKYISPGVLRKVRQFDWVDNQGYKAQKVKKAVAEKAKAKGYTVVRGNYIVGPTDPKFRKLIKEANLHAAKHESFEVGGVSPVRGGSMVHIELPHSIMDLRGMTEQDLNDLKNPNEFFAFRYHGHMTHVVQPDAGRLLKYLSQYKGINEAWTGQLAAEQMQEEIAGFELFRLNGEDAGRFIPTRAERERAAKERRKTQQDRRSRGLTKAERRDRKPEAVQSRELRKEAERSKRRRDEAKAKDRERFLEKERARKRKKKD